MGGQLGAFGVAHLGRSQFNVKDQGDVEVGAPFFNNSGGAAVLQDRVARQVKTAGVTAVGYLGLEAMANNTHAKKNDAIFRL